MFFNEDPEHAARWEARARERERLARWYQDRVKVDQAEQKPLPTAAAQPAQPAQREAVRLNAQAVPCCTNYAAGTTCFADPKENCPMLSAAPSAPQPAPPLDLSVMELAESVGLIGPASRTDDLHEAIQRFHDLIVVNASIKAARHFADGLAQQPTGEKDALLRQALDALEAYSKSGYVRHEHPKKYAAGDAVVEAIRTHLGVET